MKNKNDLGMSELEKEFELDMEKDDDEELERELESFDEDEGDKELEAEFEAIDDSDEEVDEDEEIEDQPESFAERLYELSLQEFGSMAELEAEVDRMFELFERDFFFKSLVKKGKGLVKKAAGIAKKAGVGSVLSVVKNMTGLSLGNLKSLLKPALTAAINAYIPGGGAAVGPILSALGVKEAEDPDISVQDMNNFVDFAREAYEYLAENITPEATYNPLVANNLARKAIITAKQSRQNQIRVPSKRSRGAGRVIEIKPGESVLIRAKKI